ncbi:MAG TPA: transcription elongation factor GreB [Bacteriovoracaceae bacterium]|nr:transcription elongation factor GreB [Bacteriovoracaceae bacterium]
MLKNNYITPGGFKKLQDELDGLLRVERPEVTKLVQWAASNGDRSENADYIYGKKRLREIDRRIRFLSQRLEASVVVDIQTITSEKIQFGATILVRDESGIDKTFTIVGVDEVDTSRGRISWQSPIGKSLIGKSSGDEVSIRTPNGDITYEVQSVSYHSLD